MKPGYQESEVGMIPKDWSLHPLGEIGKWFSGGTPSMSREAYWSGEVPWVSPKDMKVTRLYDALDHISELAVSDGTRLLPAGAILIVVRGMILAHSFPVARAERALAFNQDIKAVVVGSEVDSLFLLCWLAANAQRLLALTTESTHGTKRLPTESLFRELVACPPKPEQEAIAGALSDADALIESLERLFAKKREVKQGAMQELLKPKRNWYPTNIGSIADQNRRWSFAGGPFGSNLKSSDYTNDGVRIIQLQNIGDGEFKDDHEIFTSAQKADELLSCNIYPGEIILSKMGDPVARACIVPPFHERYLMCSDGIRLAVDPTRFDSYFVCTLINAPSFRTSASNVGTGSTRKRIGLSELRNLEVVCPSHAEQTAIATILRDMDAEIAALDAKLNKARLVKQGMMQELLTGRIRLV